MIIEKEETVEINGVPHKVKYKECDEYLDEEGTQALIDALKAYADTELGGN